MQTHGHVYIDGKKILVLVRASRYGRTLLARKRGRDGNHMSDEELYLRSNLELVTKLINGETIRL